MRYGNLIFQPQSVGFSFLAFGLSGGLIFAFYHVRGLSEVITAAVIISTAQFLMAATWITFMNAVIWSFGVHIPVVVLAFLFERKLAALRWGKFFVVGVVYGSMFVLLSLLVAVLQGIEDMPPDVFRQNFLDGLLIGIGLGAGVQGGEAFMHSYEQHRAERRP
jgi:hypothetical protein